MIRVTVEIREGGFSRRVQITAPYIERALKIAGDGVPGRRVRLVFPMILHFKEDEAAREHPGDGPATDKGDGDESSIAHGIQTTFHPLPVLRIGRDRLFGT